MGLGWRIFGDGETRKKRKDREKRAEGVKRTKARYAAWIRDEQCCRRCGKPVKLKSDSLFDLAHAHEIEFRSACGSPTDTRNIVILCNDCHLRGVHKWTVNETEWFVIVVLDEENGADAPDGIRFDPWETAA